VGFGSPTGGWQHPQAHQFGDTPAFFVAPNVVKEEEPLAKQEDNEGKNRAPRAVGNATATITGGQKDDHTEEEDDGKKAQVVGPHDETTHTKAHTKVCWVQFSALFGLN
jgi:hypothetical protein